MPLHNTDSASIKPAFGEWVHTPEDTGRVPETTLRSWLTEPGLLTARLRSNCGGAFQLAVLEHSAPSATTPARRRIVLRCADKACVFAETLISADTIAEYPWLATLGDEPLGERLSMEPGVTRSEFRYRLLGKDLLPAELKAEDALFWARQSDFRIAAHVLTVTEIFLPDIDHVTATD